MDIGLGKMLSDDGMKGREGWQGSAPGIVYTVGCTIVETDSEYTLDYHGHFSAIFYEDVEGRKKKKQKLTGTPRLGPRLRNPGLAWGGFTRRGGEKRWGEGGSNPGPGRRWWRAGRGREAETVPLRQVRGGGPWAKYDSRISDDMVGSSPGCIHYLAASWTSHALLDIARS